jgi:DNA phosphorothioation-dependent restriction protein DptG
MGFNMDRCPICKKLLFKKKNGTLACPNFCDGKQKRKAFNTMIDERFERRGVEFDPWSNAR